MKLVVRLTHQDPNLQPPPNKSLTYLVTINYGFATSRLRSESTIRGNILTRTFVLAAVALSAVIVGSFPPNDSASATPSVTVESNDTCEPGDDPSAEARNVAGPKPFELGPPSSEMQSMRGAAGDRDRERIHQIMNESPESYIGTYNDVEQQAKVIVVNPDNQSKVGQVRLALISGLEQTPVIIRVGCNSLQTLHRTMDDLIARDWAGSTPTEQSRATFVIEIDPASGRILLLIEESKTDVIEDALAEFGDLLMVRTGPDESGPTADAGTNRDEDVNPHWGGSKIVRTTNGNSFSCTSGFAIDRDGKRWLTTAGHCAPAGVGQHFRNDNGTFIGSVVWNRHPSTTTRDMSRFGSTNSNFNYQRIIWQNHWSSRLVTSKVLSPPQDFALCLSGQASSQLQCGFEVHASRPNQTRVCWATGCADALTSYRPTGNETARHGDSGGPLFGRTGSGEASARGMHIGRFDGLHYMYTIGEIERQMQGTVAITAHYENSRFGN